MRQSIFLRMLIFIAIYIGLRFYGGDIGRQILYPIILLVTFLHELGHALGSWVTGGEVVDIFINQDGSGLTRTAGGSRGVILMGGYLGSAVFGNLLFLIGAKYAKLATPMLILLSALMLGIGVFLFSSAFTTAFLFGFSAFLLLVVWKTSWGREILMFLGLASILHIIQDFNVGPSSDLASYAEYMKVLPAAAWMYLWLALAVMLFVLNIYYVFRKGKAIQAEIQEEDDDFMELNAIT